MKPDRLPLVHTMVGHGQPQLVLVHGLFDSSASWREVGAYLAESGFTIVTLDLRGHGDSPKPLRAYDPIDFAGDVAGLIDDLKLNAPILVGHSMGARVGYFLAAQDASPLRGLVMGDIGLEAQPDAWRDVRDFVRRLPEEFADASAAEAFITATLPPHEQAYFRRCLRPAAAPGSLRWRFSFDAAIETVRLGRAADWIGMADRIHCPVLFIRAENSTEVSRDEARRVCGAIADCSFQEIDGAEHDLHETRPREFADAVATWVRRQVMRTPAT